MEVDSELFLLDVTDPLKSFSTLEELIFIDSNNQEFVFRLSDEFEGMREVDVSYEALCDNGESFSPFYQRETKSWEFTSEDGAVIRYNLFASTLFFIRSEDDLITHGIDKLAVEIIFPNCSPFSIELDVTTLRGESTVRYNFPFSIRKHGQSYADDVISILGTSSFGSPKFVLGKGLVAFNYCDRDWVQKVQ